jgi:hypothetical protein
MENLNKDVLFLFAIKLDLRSLINFCNCSSKINEKICKNNYVWLHKLKKDFPDYENNKFLSKTMGFFNKLKDLSAKNKYIAIYNFLDKNKKDNMNVCEFYNLINPKLVEKKEALATLKKIMHIADNISLWKGKKPYFYLLLSWVSKNLYILNNKRFKTSVQNKIKEVIEMYEEEEEWNDFLYLLDI